MSQNRCKKKQSPDPALALVSIQIRPHPTVSVDNVIVDILAATKYPRR